MFVPTVEEFVAVADVVVHAYPTHPTAAWLCISLQLFEDFDAGRSVDTKTRVQFSSE